MLRDGLSRVRSIISVQEEYFNLSNHCCYIIFFICSRDLKINRVLTLCIEVHPQVQICLSTYSLHLTSIGNTNCSFVSQNLLALYHFFNENNSPKSSFNNS